MVSQSPILNVVVGTSSNPWSIISDPKDRSIYIYFVSCDGTIDATVIHCKTRFGNRPNSIIQKFANSLKAKGMVFPLLELASRHIYMLKEIIPSSNFTLDDVYYLGKEAQNFLVFLKDTCSIDDKLSVYFVDFESGGSCINITQSLGWLYQYNINQIYINQGVSKWLVHAFVVLTEKCRQIEASPLCEYITTKHKNIDNIGSCTDTQVMDVILVCLNLLKSLADFDKALRIVAVTSKCFDIINLVQLIRIALLSMRQLESKMYGKTPRFVFISRGLASIHNGNVPNSNNIPSWEPQEWELTVGAYMEDLASVPTYKGIDQIKKIIHVLWSQIVLKLSKEIGRILDQYYGEYVPIVSQILAKTKKTGDPKPYGIDVGYIYKLLLWLHELQYILIYISILFETVGKDISSVEFASYGDFIRAEYAVLGKTGSKRSRGSESNDSSPPSKSEWAGSVVIPPCSDEDMSQKIILLGRSNKESKSDSNDTFDDNLPSPTTDHTDNDKLRYLGIDPVEMSDSGIGVLALDDAARDLSSFILSAVAKLYSAFTYIYLIMGVHEDAKPPVDAQASGINRHDARISHMQPNIPNHGVNTQNMRSNIPTHGVNTQNMWLNIPNNGVNTQNMWQQMGSNIPNNGVNTHNMRSNIPNNGLHTQTMGSNIPNQGVNTQNMQPNIANNGVNTHNMRQQMGSIIPNQGVNTQQMGSNIPNQGVNMAYTRSVGSLPMSSSHKGQPADSLSSQAKDQAHSGLSQSDIYTNRKLSNVQSTPRGGGMGNIHELANKDAQ